MTNANEIVASIEHFDVMVVGAGISGVGTAYHLTTQCPGKSFVVLETNESFGGTWITHKYPGIRSDSDLYTFGYRFKPWTKAPIAQADQILAYMREVIEDNDLERHIRYSHRIERAEWSEADHRWTVTALRADTDEQVRFSVNFLWMCQGYYRHGEGYTPEWPGMADFKGRILHPQTWPENPGIEGKNVVVIGSGATAATMIPAVAKVAKHVTMLQRSPTYFTPGRNANDLADMLRGLKIDETWIHEIVRRKSVADQDIMIKRTFSEPDKVREEILGYVKMFLPEDIAERHFAPTYRYYSQRPCLVPDGDFFQAMNEGKASVVTDQIERFTETGIQLKSGKTQQADVIVTATGFNLSVLGDIQFIIDGKPLNFADTVTYRGMMFTGVPNLAWVFGYTRASWTLRVDLLADYICRMLNKMDAENTTKISVVMGPEEEQMERLPWIDPDDFNPGYFNRAMHLLPKRLDKFEWRHSQDYAREKELLPQASLDDPALVYEKQESGKEVRAA